ncbi:hypothetical protein A6B37_13135 [Achromobacter sp. HZ01]|jgi:hypothetical protein|uniref:Uncharacterized protein n=1 Tax=Achromobacter pulmonis TaxID=1389932 RepID=A0A2N8KJF3_9BURK|nr:MULTISPECIES: hypothetical protein [Achromobacter]MBO9327810.1 hypothetical protein [Achromobacter xylosoxidans]PND33576.1 hypothetical protein C1I89_13975 [Achromobacter pulmonis]RAP63364.1 hypothetical protein A6B37_13135 [Achromobacter sp. HZ01]
MDRPAAGLNALIAQCRRLEAALSGREDPAASAAMHRFVEAMDAYRAPPGMWSPLALAVLVMTGGLGVGIGLLDLLLHGAGSALAAFALVLVCACMALALAIGVVSFMGGYAYGLVLLRRLALGLIVVGLLGVIAWMQGDMHAVGPVVALLGGLGAWLVLNCNGFYVFVGYQMARRYLERRR